MEFSALRQIYNVLSGAAQYLRCFRRVDEAVGSKVSKISRCQGNVFANPVEHSVRNSHIYVPCNAVSARLHLYLLKKVRFFEQDLKGSCLFKMLLQIAFLHCAISEKYQ